MLSLFVLFAASAGETCADPFASHVSWDLPDAAVELEHGVLIVDGVKIADRVYEPLAIRGTRLVFVRGRTDHPGLDLVALDLGTLETTPLIEKQSPNQPALSEDGETVAFVNGASAITAVYVMPFDGSAEPVQLTNTDLVRRVGRPPEGFVDSPRDGLRFDGPWLSWEGATATHTVRWSGGVK